MRFILKLLIIIKHAMKRLSKYTIFHNQNGRNYMFHQLSKALLEIDTELYKTLTEADLSKIPQDIQKDLEKSGFLVDNNIDESYKLRYANLINRYNSKVLRLTILPTINCNFRCWYCYEQHEPSLMKEDNILSILKFAKTEIEIKHIKKVVLDWFGGEPLLRFYQIVYPLSKALKSFCDEHHVDILITMTTNGSLINKDVAIKMKEIGLEQLQITLDGGKENHNKVRYSHAIRDSYKVIVNNIHLLCKILDKPNIILRINYTSENIDSTYSILDDFDEDTRKFILISPHIVWQESYKMSDLSAKVTQLKKYAYEKGYCIRNPSLSRRCMSCYTENMEQFVINYDMNVYKCTARDFNKKFCVGKITEAGKFEPNELYYRYYTTSSPFVCKECLKCDLLPSCIYSSSCLQKKIEGYQPKCDKDMIVKSVHEDIAFKLRKSKQSNSKNI